MNGWTFVAAAAALATLTGCMQKQGSATTPANRVPAAKVTGAAKSCIPISQILESKVRDDRTIDFRMGGNHWYRNTLPARCPGLGFEKAFSYQTSLNQLCSTDIIRVLSTTGGAIDQRAACGLGEFVPVELAK